MVFSFFLKGTVVEEKTEFTYSFSREIDSEQSFEVRSRIRAYTGPKKVIHWVDEVETDCK